MTRTTIPNTRARLKGQSGLSLVELMVAVLIGLFLVFAVTVLIVQQSGTRDELDKTSGLVENGRYAIQLLSTDIEHAGFYGNYFPTSSTTYTVPDPCSTTLANLGWDSSVPSVPVAIYGYAPASANPTTCSSTSLLTNYQPNTAILVVRRTGTTAVAPAGVIAGTVYLQSSQCATDSSRFVFSTSSFALKKKDCTSAAPIYPYIVRIYYVSSCDVCSPSDGIPTLKVVEFTGGSQSTLSLVEGIESMQLDYGIASSSTSLSPASYTTTPASGDWSNVVAVRINLLVRNTAPSASYTDTKTYALGGFGSVTPGGNYKHHVFSELVRVINVSERRE